MLCLLSYRSLISSILWVGVCLLSSWLRLRLGLGSSLGFGLGHLYLRVIGRICLLSDWSKEGEKGAAAKKTKVLSFIGYSG